MRLRETHRIHIVLDGKDYGTRHWVNAPRQGEYVMLKRSGAAEHFVAKITQVTWGVAVDDMDTSWPTINLHCKTDGGGE